MRKHVRRPAYGGGYKVRCLPSNHSRIMDPGRFRRSSRCPLDIGTAPSRPVPPRPAPSRPRVSSSVCERGAGEQDGSGGGRALRRSTRAAAERRASSVRDGRASSAPCKAPVPPRLVIVAHAAPQVRCRCCRSSPCPRWLRST